MEEKASVVSDGELMCKLGWCGWEMGCPKKGGGYGCECPVVVLV